MEMPSSDLTQHSPIDNTSKKRTADDLNATEASQKATKKPKTPGKPTLATGFLFDGTWVEDAKFACLKCMNGHRTGKCEHAGKGIPVFHLNKVGRPTATESKSLSKCLSPKSEPCTCRHESYILEEIIVDNEKKWKIQKAVLSNCRCEIVLKNLPRINYYSGGLPGMMMV